MEAKDTHCPKLKMNGKKSSKFQFRLPVLLEALDAEKKLEKMVTWTWTWTWTRVNMTTFTIFDHSQLENGHSTL